MNIIHRIAFHNDTRAASMMEKKGVKLHNGIITAFDIGENDKNWPAIQELCKIYQVFNWQYKTTFTKKELQSAVYYAIEPLWHFEYPQPTDNFGYSDTTYASTDACPDCGIGCIQQGLFSIKKSPKWKKRNVLQLNWIFDEYFVSKALKEKLQGSNKDFSFKMVLKYPTKEFLDDIYQLEIKQSTDIDTTRMSSFSKCEKCGYIKYLPHTCGFYPKPLVPIKSLSYTNQFFGSGHQAFRGVVINKEIYNLFLEAGVKGITYIPCASCTDKKQD